MKRGDRWVIWTARSHSLPGWRAVRAAATRFGLARDGASIIGVDICADIPANHYPMASRAELDETVELVEAEGGKMLGIGRRRA